MKHLDAIGQAHLDAAEGQLALSRDLGRWLGRAASRWLDALLRHVPEGRVMPW